MMFLSRGSAFRSGFGRLASAVRKRSVPEQSKFSLSYLKNNKIDLVAFDDMIRSLVLQRTQAPIIKTVHPAIEKSVYLTEKYPDLQSRTVQNILGGLPDVTDIEYLNTLPVNDLRRHLLATIQDPGPERRAELIDNLQAIDAERGEVVQKESTYSVYQKLSREGIDINLLNTFERAAEEETRRRERAEFTEYMKEGWNSLFGYEELSKFVKKCFEKRETGLVCTHPSLSVWFPYNKKGQPPTNYSLSELTDMRIKKAAGRNSFNGVFEYVVYPAIDDSPIIAEKYPDPADRTPHKLLGGLGNMVSIEYMQSLEPHDPRRLFLDTLEPLCEKRSIEVENNVLLINQAITERIKGKPGEFSLRTIVLLLVSDALEENYLATLVYAKHAEHNRIYAKSNGAKTDPEDDAYRKELADMTARFGTVDAPEV